MVSTIYICMDEYKKKVYYFPCAYCEEIINTMLSEDRLMSQYEVIRALERKMNKKTAIKHIDDLIREDILTDFSNPPQLLFDEIKGAFLEKTSLEYGRPTRKGILDFANENDQKLLMQVLEGNRKRQRRVYVLWFNYEWLNNNLIKSADSSRPLALEDCSRVGN